MAKFTFYLVLFETYFEVMRGKEDKWNSFWGGGIAAMAPVMKSKNYKYLNDYLYSSKTIFHNENWSWWRYNDDVIL